MDAISFSPDLTPAMTFHSLKPVSDLLRTQAQAFSCFSSEHTQTTSFFGEMPIVQVWSIDWLVREKFNFPRITPEITFQTFQRLIVVI